MSKLPFAADAEERNILEFLAAAVALHALIASGKTDSFADGGVKAAFRIAGEFVAEAENRYVAK